MPNEFRKQASASSRVSGPAVKKPKQTFMDRVKQIVAQEKPENPVKKEPVNPEGKKGSKLQEIQERANRIESE